MEAANLDAPELCLVFGVSRARACVMVQREPTVIERLAMKAVFHRLNASME